MYSTHSLKTYLDDLAARKPAPGGGSAAALVGALGCALLSMVCNYTLGKDKYKSVEKQIKGILGEVESMRERFLVLVDLDVEAYYKVFNSRKGSPSIYQANLKNATLVPLEICALAVKGYKFCAPLLKIANKYLISDVYVAKELLKSCLKSAQFNVKVNIPQIKDKRFTAQTKKKISILRKNI